MKYHTVDSFFQGCKHPTSTYMVVGATRDERDRLFANVIAHLPLACTRTLCLDAEHLCREMESGSLWDKNRVFILEGAESISKKDVAKIEQSVKTGSYLLIGGEKFPSTLQELYLALKQHMLLLDLTAEKVWDHEERLKKHMIKYAQERQKTLSFSVAEHLLKKTGPHIALLESELDKAICYIKERASIERLDIDLLCPYQPEDRAWKIAEAIIWQKEASYSVEDTSDFLTICGLLRYHLELAMLLAARTPFENIHTLFPKLQMTSLKKYAEKIAQRSPSDFQSKLSFLFHYESLAKTAQIAPKTLWSLLYARLVS